MVKTLKQEIGSAIDYWMQEFNVGKNTVHASKDAVLLLKNRIFCLLGREKEKLKKGGVR
jgi:hypothetical protein